MHSSKFILSLVNIDSEIIGTHLKTHGSAGVIYEYGCLGFRELAFFVVFIALQNGHFKNKIWYIPSGIIILTILNLIRIVIIIIGQHKDQDLFHPLHDIVSPIIMYPAILFLWLFWLSKYGKTR